jgi:hypothetical protein
MVKTLQHGWLALYGVLFPAIHVLMLMLYSLLGMHCKHAWLDLYAFDN